MFELRVAGFHSPVPGNKQVFHGYVYFSQVGVCSLNFFPFAFHASRGMKFEIKFKLTVSSLRNFTVRWRIVTRVRFMIPSLRWWNKNRLYCLWIFDWYGGYV